MNKYEILYIIDNDVSEEDKAVPDYRLMAEINMHKDKND